MKQTTSLVARTLAILTALEGKSITGAGITELAKATGIPPPTVTRIIKTMIKEGFCIQLNNGRYAHSIHILQIAKAHADEMLRTQNRIHELIQRVSAPMN